MVKRKTARSRLTRAIHAIAQWCRLNRHRPVAEQHQTLSQKLRGHFAYYGITGNAVCLSRFRHEVAGIWRKWLGRRKRGGPPPWERFAALLKRYPLPAAVTVHSVCRPQRIHDLRNRMR